MIFIHLCSCRHVLNRLLIWSRKKFQQLTRTNKKTSTKRPSTTPKKNEQKTLTKRPSTTTTYLLQKLPWCLPGIVGNSVEEEIVPLVHLIGQCDKDSDAHNCHHGCGDRIVNPHLELVQLLLHRLHLHHHLAHQLLAT